jgi:hypothetical protein
VVTTAVATRGKYFPEGRYTMHGDKQLMDIAESTTLPTAMRLFMLASARSNYWGHAPFSRKEICETLGISEPTRRTAIDSLKSGKVIAPESTHLCIVLSAAIVRRADRTYKTCIERKHVDRQKLMWIGGEGWETRVGEWLEAINDPARALMIAKRITRKRRVVEETETVEEIRVVDDPWA